MPRGKEAKRAANKASYARAKVRQDAALLRLEKGDLARLDAACSAAGLSRSAFAKLYLLPLAEAMASRLFWIEERRSAERVSLATFFARAMDKQLTVPVEVPAAPIADEFDALFGPKEDPC